MAKFDIITNKDSWSKIVNSFDNTDVYFKYGYFVPFSNYSNIQPNLFFYESESGKVAYPYMLRDIALCPGLNGKIDKDKYFDISSAYGYGGPLYETNDLPKLKSEFMEIFSIHCAEKNIISQFDRFHPILKNHLFFDGYSELAQIRKTVHLDLADSDTIWKNIDPKCRNMIRKAEKCGVVVKVDDDRETLSEFTELYQATMKRNCTEEFYFFSREFFNDTMLNLGENVFISNAYFEDKLIASALFMKNEKKLHYHFSGSDPEYRNLQANSLLLYKTALYGLENGIKIFHLGGGFESEKDSLFKFKKSFNRNEPNDFFIGKKIHSSEQYDQMVIKSANSGIESTFFPKYRA
jgi:serine/alanine adding enzyme